MAPKPKSNYKNTSKQNDKTVTVAETNRTLTANEIRSGIIYKILEFADENGMSRPDIRYVCGSIRNMEAFLIREWNVHYPSQIDTQAPPPPVRKGRKTTPVPKKIEPEDEFGEDAESVLG